MESRADRRRGDGHLPAGHAPGAQSRRIARNTPVGLIVVVLLGVGLLGGAIALLVVAPSTKSPSGSRVGAAILGAGALLLIALVAHLLRRWRPRTAGHLELRVEPIELRRGDTVTATLVISDPGKLGEKLELGLVCTEYHDRSKTVQTQYGRQQQRITEKADASAQWYEPDRQQTQQWHKFTVPDDAPFSYEGGTVSWAWHVSVVDRHAHRTDAHRDVAIWVSP